MNDNAARRYRRPSYHITLDEQDITPKINGRLIPLCLRAQRGEATFDITLAEGHADILPEPPTHGPWLQTRHRHLTTVGNGSGRLTR